MTIETYEILKEDIKEIRADVREIRDEKLEELRKRMHATENNLAASSQLIAETISNLNRAIDDIEIMENKYKESEKTIGKIKIVTSHWKLIAGIIITSMLVGFFAEKGLKDDMKVLASIFLPDKITKTMEKINNG